MLCRSQLQFCYSPTQTPKEKEPSHAEAESLGWPGWGPSRVHLTQFGNENTKKDKYQKKIIPQHIFFRNKEKSSKRSQRKNTLYLEKNKDNSIQLLFRKHESKKRKKEIFKVLRENNHQIRILHTVKLSFKCKGDIKTFLDKQK